MFLFASSVGKKKKEVRLIQKNMAGDYKKKKRESLFDRVPLTIVFILRVLQNALNTFCGFWSLKVPHSLGIVLEYIRVRRENLSKKFEWKKA